MQYCICVANGFRPGTPGGLFMSLCWFGQGVIWLGILCSFFYVLYFFVLAGYGSQSGTAV